MHSHSGLFALSSQFHHDFFYVKIISTLLFSRNHEAQTLYILRSHLRLLHAWLLKAKDSHATSWDMLHLRSQVSLLESHHHIRKSHICFLTTFSSVKNGELERTDNFPQNAQLNRAHCSARILTHLAWTQSLWLCYHTPCPSAQL